MFSVEDRDTALNQLVAWARADQRVEAAVLTGSLAANEADRWSDIDFALVVADGTSERVAADWVARAYRDLSVAHHYETDFGTTLVRGLFLSNALLLDLAFTPSGDFSAWAKVTVLFDRTGIASRAAENLEARAPAPDWRNEAGLAWHDIMHACTAISRGKLWQGLYFLQRIRNRTLAIASERNGRDSSELRHVDELPPQERDALLGSLVPHLTRPALFQAVDVAASAFLSELRRGDSELAGHLGPHISTFIETIAGSRDNDA